MKLKIVQIIISINLLFIGGMIYVIFRPTSLLLFSWLDKLGLDPTIQSIRLWAKAIDLPYFFKYCFPNALWISSYIIMINAIIPINNNKIFWAIILPFISLICEFLQIAHIMPGIFDIGDLLCYIIPSLIYLVIYKIKYHEIVF